MSADLASLVFVILFTMIVTFATYTYEPPQHELFRDPKTETYGFPQ